MIKPLGCDAALALGSWRSESLVVKIGFGNTESNATLSQCRRYQVHSQRNHNSFVNASTNEPDPPGRHPERNAVESKDLTSDDEMDSTPANGACAHHDYLGKVHSCRKSRHFCVTSPTNEPGAFLGLSSRERQHQNGWCFHGAMTSFRAIYQFVLKRCVNFFKAWCAMFSTVAP